MLRILSVRTKPENLRPVLAKQVSLVAGITLGVVIGFAHDVCAQTSQNVVPSSQASKRVVPTDPVGKLFNDGPRVVYTQESDADSIEKLFWDRELKKEKLRILRESQQALPPEVKASVEPKAVDNEPTATPAEPQAGIQPLLKQETQQTSPGERKSATAKQQPKKIDASSSRQVSDTKPDKGAKPMPAPQAIPQEISASTKHAADAGKVDGVGINAAIWPVNATPQNGYGKKGPEGRPWQGLVFDVPVGTPVKSIDSGRVMYAHEFKNYGNLVIVDHGDRVASVYANNQKLLVKEGDLIGTGDVIALSGKTGSLDYPALYFEIRKEGKPVDPQQFLKRR